MEGFLEVFYEHMWRAYLKPHEAGLRALFANIKDVCPPAIAKTHEARKTLRKAIEAHAAKVGKATPI